MASSGTFSLPTIKTAGMTILPFDGTDWRAWKNNVRALMVMWGWINGKGTVRSVVKIEMTPEKDKDAEEAKAPTPSIHLESYNYERHNQHAISNFNQGHMTTLYGFLHLSIKPSILTMLGEVELGNGMEMWI